MNITSRQIIWAILAGLALSFMPFSASAQKKLEDRVTRLERLLESGALTEMHNQQEQLRRALQEIQANIDQMQRELAEIKQRQHDLYLDNDRRLQQLESAAIQVPMPAPEDDVSADADTDSDSENESEATPGNEREDYQSALASLRAGRYEEATAAFQSFLQRYPQDHYTANALYWLGESYYVVRDFPNALSAFERVLQEHPTSAKGPDALLKIGFIHHEKGDAGQARIALEKVRTDYPNTSAAALAEQRLKRL